MIRRIIMLIGFSHMSKERIDWIKDFLNLFKPSLNAVLGHDPIQLCCDSDAYFLEFASGDIVIGHELPKYFTKRLSRENITYIDIRVSPVRFCSHDNLLAINSNDPYFRSVLHSYRVSDHNIAIEAESLKLSFRYRELGQSAIRDQSLFIFTEQNVDNDSIHFKSPTSIRCYGERIERALQEYRSVYFSHRGSDLDEDPSFLRSLGAERCNTNLYAILTSDRVAAIAAIRGGVLEEARYFGRKVIALGEITTPLERDEGPKSNTKFVNILPNDGLSNAFWHSMLHVSSATIEREVIAPFPWQNIIRRATNNWNSTASGLHLEGQPWQELVREPIRRAIFQMQEELDFRRRFQPVEANKEVKNLAGDWQWFTGGIVRIEASGFVRSDEDYGWIEKTSESLCLHWQRRHLIDILFIGLDGQSFETRNQYGDGGVVRRVITDLK